MKILFVGQLFILLILVVSSNLFAQSKYQSGFIITSELDTIHGFIYDDIDSQLAFVVKFKKDTESERYKEYSTDNLVGFRFDNGRAFEKMPLMEKTDGLEDSLYVFTKRVVTGKIDLLIWRRQQNSYSDIFLVNNISGQMVQLTKPKKSSVTDSSGNKYSKKDKKYIGLLNYIKTDSDGFLEKDKEIRFGEKSLTKDIIEYNKIYEEEFPVQIYNERKAFNYNILFGLPIKQTDGLRFRVAVYRDKNWVEKSDRVSIVSGIIYHHWSERKGWDRSFENGTSNYRWQFLNIVPVGIKYRLSNKIVQPYGYIGAGLGILMMTDYKIVNYENQGSKISLVPLPTINLGVGTKVRVGSNYILAEVTPTINGIFANVGFSF